MNIVVIGANGGVGKQTVELALKAGHHVTALLRNPAKLTLTHPNLEVVKGDILVPGSLDGILENKDVIISAIGIKGRGPTTLYSLGNSHLLDAMKRKGARRIFFISASALDISPVLPFFVRLVAKYVVQKILRNMYVDLREMERLVKTSETDWTIMRPPRLTDRPVTGHYRFAINQFLKNCLNISRADLAHFMIHNVTNTATFNSTIEIAY
ncbi:MAG: SDR family oxidoreductase [Bacteroidota bacterium]